MVKNVKTNLAVEAIRVIANKTHPMKFRIIVSCDLGRGTGFINTSDFLVKMTNSAADQYMDYLSRTADIITIDRKDMPTVHAVIEQIKPIRNVKG